MRSTAMWGKPITKMSRIVFVLALATATFSCGDDDDQTEGTTDEATENTAAPTAAPAVECDLLYPFVENTLNDRCEPGSGRWGEALVKDPVPPWHSTECPQMVAVPDEIIVAIDPNHPGGLDLATEVEEVVGQLHDFGASSDGTPVVDNIAQIVRLTAGTDVEAVLNMLPQLQEAGRNVDLNYLEPLQPNNGFRPY